MEPKLKNKINLLLLITIPIVSWLFAVRATISYKELTLASVFTLIEQTPQKPALLISSLLGFLIAFIFVLVINKLTQTEFKGAYFSKVLRGTKIVSASKLKKLINEPNKEQVIVAGLPMPTEIENLHILTVGSTGSGKSVLLRQLVFTAMLRGDRMIITDPNGDMLSKFWQERDVILNPYDDRSKGWSFFNEIRDDYDFQRYALSIVPRGKTAEAEEWAGYARLLLRETARKLYSFGNPSVYDLFKWTTIVSPEELKEFLTGTDAESLFVGAQKALASARFILADKLPEHKNMPTGNFSLRKWLEDNNGGNLYITWREDDAVSLRPLISAWVDVLCTSILSLPEDKNRHMWLVLDELASLEKLPSLIDALTKGRKAGLRLVAGLQSTAQLDDIYGREEAQVLRACFRSLVVLGGAKTDSKTCLEMSKSLGEHEVEREKHSESSGSKESSSNKSTENVKESVVMPEEIASLDDLTGYVAFAGNRPIAKVKLELLEFVNITSNFKKRIK